LIQTHKSSWKYDIVYACLFLCQSYLQFIFWIVLFHLISLHFNILGYNITNFTIRNEIFLNFEIE